MGESRAANLKLAFLLTALTLGLGSCEVVLWQEPAPADTSLLRLPEWNPTPSSVPLLPGATTVTLQGNARPSGLARYPGSTPEAWGTLKTARVRWEDGTLVTGHLSTAPESSGEVWPQRYAVTLEIPLRVGNAWFESSLEDTWGYSSPWKRIAVTGLTVP